MVRNRTDKREQNTINTYAQEGNRDFSIFRFGKYFLFNLLVKGKGSPFNQNNMNSITAAQLEQRSKE